MYIYIYTCSMHMAIIEQPCEQPVSYIYKLHIFSTFRLHGKWASPGS